MHTQTTDNYRKHKTTNPIQKLLINNFYNALLSEAERLQPNSILDVGCGEGFTLERLKKRKIGRKLTGIDFLKRAIEIGKKERPYLDLSVGNIYDITFKDNSFDL
ncbi:MAG: class I SAM-dependent methyltransferase [Candidatus Levybacteria bacterium]|nr:class I SAM-dependent methyltransferase [Candidatus Levybacteria bacterium]